MKKINDIIKDLNNIWFNINLNNIKTNTIDEIYIQIIIWLIENDKFENYNYANKIIEKLNLESIDITKIMFEKILYFFENKKNMLNYEISKIEDLLDNKKINFYYILFKYILKNSIYIYQIPFLLKNKRNLLFIIKNNNFKKFTLENKDIIKKLEYIIKIFLDSNYYLDYIKKKY